MTKLIVALRKSANSPKKDELYKTVTILEMASVSMDCGVVEFARCCAQYHVVTNVLFTPQLEAYSCGVNHRGL